MRRSDREVTNQAEIIDIINHCDVCRIAFHAGKYPYIIPMNFGFCIEGDKQTLYFHTATAGTKLELLKENANVAFEMDCSHNLLLGNIACNSTMEYESVCGNGELRIADETEKLNALNIIMDHYQPEKKHEFDYNEVKAVEVLELQIDEIHAKRLKKPSESNKEDIGTLSCAKEYASLGRIEAWVQKFLRTTGNNLALASGLLHAKRYYLGPVRMSMRLFDIPEGAPDYLSTENDIEWFFHVSDKMTEALEDGWDMPPLIVYYEDGKYTPMDGRHRFEALRKMDAQELHAIIWTSSEKDYNDLLKEERITKEV